MQSKTGRPTIPSVSGNGKKAVRIQEPEVTAGELHHLNVVHIDPVSDYTSTATTKTSHLEEDPEQDLEIESSYI